MDQCGRDLVHGLRSMISISSEMGFVEVASLNDGAGGGYATGPLQLSSEQTFKNDVRHRYPSIKTPAAWRSLGKLGISCPSSWDCSRAQFLNTSIEGRVLAFLMRMRLVAERCRVPDGPERPMR